MARPLRPTGNGTTRKGFCTLESGVSYGHVSRICTTSSEPSDGESAEITVSLCGIPTWPLKHFYKRLNATPFPVPFLPFPVLPSCTRFIFQDKSSTSFFVPASSPSIPPDNNLHSPPPSKVRVFEGLGRQMVTQARHLRSCVCVYTYIHTYIHIYIYIYLSLSLYVCVCSCACLSLPTPPQRPLSTPTLTSNLAGPPKLRPWSVSSSRTVD